MSRGWRQCIYTIATAGLIARISGAEITSACSSTSFTITSQADADLLNNCTTLTGNLFLQSNELTQITFSSVETINGNFSALSCNALRTIVAPNLSLITRNFTLSNLPLLTELQFPLLDSLNGAIYWDTLPNLNSVSFGNVAALTNELPGANVDGDIMISGTALSSLEFLNFTHYSEPNMIWIKGNTKLDTVNLTGLSWGSNSLQIVDNGPSTQILLPDLRSVGDVMISNAGNITLPKLSDTSGRMTIFNNTLNVLSVPVLTDIEGSLIIQENAHLDDISLPALFSVKGDITITNNTDLHMIGDMNKLFYSEGTVTLDGGFTIVILPSLRSVTSGFHLNTTHPAFDCTFFDKLASSESWSSSFYSCGAYTPGSSTDLAIHFTKSSSSSLSPRLSRNVKLFVIVISVLAGLFLIALGLRIYAKRTGIWKSPMNNLRGSLTRTRSGGHLEGERGVSLDDLGVSRAAEEGDQLPKYTRVGDPGEVPPVYTSVVGQGGAGIEDGNGTGTGYGNGNGIAQMGVMPARTPTRRWRFW